MSNEDPERLAKLLILFFQEFDNAKLNSDFLNDYGFDNILEFKFTLEHEDIQLPANLKDALSSAVNCKDLVGNDSQF